MLPLSFARKEVVMNSYWSQVKNSFIEWYHGMSSGSELANLSDRILRDIGLYREEANVQAPKPFWLA
jgi:uncharacterized protein YjiS (DUF1127 family)